MKDEEAFMSGYPHLLSPGRIGTLELKNYEWRLTELAIVGL